MVLSSGLDGTAGPGSAAVRRDGGHKAMAEREYDLMPFRAFTADLPVSDAGSPGGRRANY